MLLIHLINDIDYNNSKDKDVHIFGKNVKFDKNVKGMVQHVKSNRLEI